MVSCNYNSKDNKVNQVSGKAKDLCVLLFVSRNTLQPWWLQQAKPMNKSNNVKGVGSFPELSQRNQFMCCSYAGLNLIFFARDTIGFTWMSSFVTDCNNSVQFTSKTPSFTRITKTFQTLQIRLKPCPSR